MSAWAFLCAVLATALWAGAVFTQEISWVTAAGIWTLNTTLAGWRE